MRPFICTHLWLLVPAIFLAPAPANAQDYAGHRLSIGPGTLLLIPDHRTGLTIWARRDTRPGHRPSPDFVGWVSPESTLAWVDQSRQLLAHPPPGEGDALEGPLLVATDQGRVGLMQTGDPINRRFGLTFGHPGEQQRWLIEATASEVGRLLDTLEFFARSSRLAPPEGLGYANPTHRSVTPDRKGGALPAVAGKSGEIWATAELNAAGEVIPGTSRVLWASGPELTKAVLNVLPGYRYQRKDGGRERLAVYQRFRVR